MTSKSSNSQGLNSSGGEFKITFYSTSPNEESKSKYPRQMKTSYVLPDTGDTEINFGKPLNLRPKTRVTGFQTESTRSVPSSNANNSTSPNNEEIIVSRSGRVSKKPKRYEPVETVLDDYDEIDYNTDDSSEN